jgi:hypothetical protein
MNNNENKKSYTPMNKRTATTTTTSSVNVDEFPPLTTTKSSYSNITILNFLQAAKKVPEPLPEEQSLMMVTDDEHVDVDVEPFIKGCSFYTDEELILMQTQAKLVNKK